MNPLNIYALFISVLTFFGKLLIFQRTFSRKLSPFLVFDNDFENEIENVFPYQIYIYIDK